MGCGCGSKILLTHETNNRVKPPSIPAGKNLLLDTEEGLSIKGKGSVATSGPRPNVVWASPKYPESFRGSHGKNGTNQESVQGGESSTESI